MRKIYIINILAMLGVFIGSCSHVDIPIFTETTTTSTTTTSGGGLDDFMGLSDSGRNFTGTGSIARSNTPTQYFYGKHPWQWGFLYTPTIVTASTPVIVFVHGGGYAKQVTSSYTSPLCKDLVSYGFICWNIEYRRLGCGGGLPMTIQDVINAILYLITLKNTPNTPIDSPLPTLNLNNVTVIGHSAGAHLGALAVTKINSMQHTVKITRFIGLAGVYNLITAVTRDNDPFIQKFMGSKPNPTNLAQYQQLSPINHTEKMRPVKTLLFTGVQDGVVSVKQSTDYTRKLKVSKAPVKIVFIPNGNHTNIINVKKPLWTKIRKTIITFITQQ